eukprot:6226281-Ditylum_brightwellii.AAC.1
MNVPTSIAFYQSFVKFYVSVHSYTKASTKECRRHTVVSEEHKCPMGDHMSIEDLYSPILKLSKKLKK